MQQGFFSIQQACRAVMAPADHSSPCKNCSATGASNNTKPVRKNPAGVDNDDRIRLTVKVNQARMRNNGDLYVVIHTKPHPVFSVR